MTASSTTAVRRTTATSAGAGAPGTHQPVGATVDDLLRHRAHLPEGHPDRSPLRTRCIEAGLPLARRLAATYLGRGEALEDLEQVAALALVRAVDGYDHSRHVAFACYAVPTIVGALKRHFRDSTWRIRVPRGTKELAVRLASASARLTQQLRRSPTLRELAADLGATEGQVAVALNAWLAHHPASLDALSGTDGEELRLIDAIGAIGAIDTRFDLVIDLHALRSLLSALTVRQHRILAMRYFEELTQAEIANRIGVSQMHVSRLLVQTLAQLRAGMLAE